MKQTKSGCGSYPSSACNCGASTCSIDTVKPIEAPVSSDLQIITGYPVGSSPFQGRISTTNASLVRKNTSSSQ